MVCVRGGGFAVLTDAMISRCALKTLVLVIDFKQGNPGFSVVLVP